MKTCPTIAQFIAHRGMPYEAPENTLASFRKAHALGATWVECDVMLTKDKQPVIMHDVTLDRTTNGRGRVDNYDFSEIAELDAGQGEQVPLLSEFLNLAATLDLGINLEIKAQRHHAEFIANEIYEALQLHWPSHLKKPLISSFEPTCLTAYRKKDPTACLGYIIHEWTSDCIDQLKQLNASTLSIYYEEITKERMTLLHEAGYLVLAYTVDDPVKMQELLALGVDGIFTNDFRITQKQFLG